MKLMNLFGLGLFAATSVFAQLPKATEIISKMGFGFNLGNSMEVPNDPTGWGNPYPSQDLLDSIKALGFQTVRIPCAWDSHAPGGVITENWLDSVKVVVDYAIKDSLYVVLNIHHEGQGGWFQTSMAETKNDAIDTKLKNYWTQIANKFKDYNEHLLFAGANEPGEGQKGLTWTSEHAKVLMGYYQTFIDAVRATGGNNETRTLIIQGLQTDIDKSVQFIKPEMLPTDKVPGYMMFEVHYYEPYQFTIMEHEEDWGAPDGAMILTQYFYGDYQSTDLTRNAGYNAWTKAVDATISTGEHVNTQFKKIADAYGMPVIIGEFGANTRSPELDGEDLVNHLKGRTLWHKHVAEAAKKNGVVPILWDMGNESNSKYGNMAYIRRQSDPVGKLLDADAINAIRSVYELAPAEGGVPVEITQPGANKAAHITYKTVQSDSSEGGILRVDLSDANWTQYVAISFDMRVDGASAGPCLDQTRDGCGDYGWASVSVFNMSGAWDWKEVSLGNVDSLAKLGLKNYKVEFGTAAGQLAITTPDTMKAVGINVYGTQFTGDMYLDNLLLWKADGTADTLCDFNKLEPSTSGIAKATLINANDTGDWGESAAPTPSDLIKAFVATTGKVRLSVQQGIVTASFATPKATYGTATLMNSLGQVIAKQNFNANAGQNSLALQTNYRGTAFLSLQIGSQRVSSKLTLK